MKQITILSGIVFFLALLPIEAAVIYDNGPFIPNSNAVPSDFSSSSQTGPYQAADDFLFQSKSQLVSVSWLGLYLPSNAPLPQEHFRIRVFFDSGGHPEFSPTYQYAIADPGRTNTNILSFGKFVYAYYALLPSPLILQGNTRYWLSIVDDTTLDTHNNWYWHCVSAGGSLELRDFETSQWTSYPVGTLAFKIEGNILPEPSTSLFLISSAFLFLGRRTFRGA